MVFSGVVEVVCNYKVLSRVIELSSMVSFEECSVMYVYSFVAFSTENTSLLIVT